MLIHRIVALLRRVEARFRTDHQTLPSNAEIPNLSADAINRVRKAIAKRADAGSKAIANGTSPADSLLGSMSAQDRNGESPDLERWPTLGNAAATKLMKADRRRG
jgi:hypothetical protein